MTCVKRYCHVESYVKLLHKTCVNRYCHVASYVKLLYMTWLSAIVMWNLM